ncbi:MAG: hypothetical protein ABIV07_07660 [Polaromonas sp.]
MLAAGQLIHEPDQGSLADAERRKLLVMVSSPAGGTGRPLVQTLGATTLLRQRDALGAT